LFFLSNGFDITVYDRDYSPTTIATQFYFRLWGFAGGGKDTRPHERILLANCFSASKSQKVGRLKVKNDPKSLRLKPNFGLFGIRQQYHFMGLRHKKCNLLFT
jgi:hypothetical protein